MHLFFSGAPALLKVFSCNTTRRSLVAPTLVWPFPTPRASCAPVGGPSLPQTPMHVRVEYIRACMRDWGSGFVLSQFPSVLFVTAQCAGAALSGLHHGRLRVASAPQLHLYLVTKRRNSWACIGNPKPEQETIKGTNAQETSAYQSRPITQHAAQGSNPPITALYMQLAKRPHTHQTTPPATRAASADQHGTHRGRNRYHPSAHITKDEAPGQLLSAQKHG